MDLAVESLGCHWAMRKERFGVRARPEAYTAIRWVRRLVQRLNATVVSDPLLTLPQGCIDHWWMDVPCIRIKIRLIPEGRTHGLPEKMLLDANVVRFEQLRH